MTKDELMKAWFICCTSKDDCSGCPILELERKNGHKCKYNVFVGALNLITEQEKEIEQLKAENERLAKVVSSKVYDFVNNIVDETTTHLDIEKQAKIDVLNKLRNDCVGVGVIMLTDHDIDKIIKEIEK